MRAQWAVQDPTDDLVADQALFPAVVSAATLLNTDSSQASQLQDRGGPDRAVSAGQPVQPERPAELAADVGIGGRR